MKIASVYTVGKRLVMEADSPAVVIHFLMFGSYRLNERRGGMVPRLSLSLYSHELNFYNCSVKIIHKQELVTLDVKTDVLNPDFAKEGAMEAVQEYPGMIADLLLDQTVFGGVGNITKNEALYAAGIHPASISRNIPREKTKTLIQETIRFSSDFLEVKRAGQQLKPDPEGLSEGDVSAL